MRYPVSQADWPTAFNKFAKYLGRHWPTGKLSLNDARERTARLLGYHSVHDLKKELLAEPIPFKRWDLKSHFWMKAWVLYRCPISGSKSLFERLPWGELSANSARESALKEKPFVILDEFSYYGDSKTNKRMIQMLEDNILPPYGYALNRHGEIYHAEDAENLLELTDSFESPSEVGFEGNVEEFVEQHIKPLFWRPLDEMLEEVTLEGSHKLASGTACYVHRYEQTDAYIIRYLGLGFSAFLPVIVRTDQELRNALRRFLLREPFYDLYSPYDTQVFYAATKETPCEGQWFEWNGQLLYSQKGENGALWSSLGEALPNLNRYLDAVSAQDPVHFLSSESIRIYKAVEQWHDIRKIEDAYLGMSQEKRISCLHRALGATQMTGEDYIKMGMLVPEDHPTTIGECLGNRGVIREERETLESMGQQVLKQHPELSAFYDDEALGYLYLAYDDYGYASSGMLEPNASFIGFVVYRALCVEYKSNMSIDYRSLPSMCMLALHWILFSEEEKDECFIVVWRKWVSLLNRYHDDVWFFRNVLRDKDELKVINTDDRFISNGPRKEIVLQSMTEMLSQIIRNTLN